MEVNRKYSEILYGVTHIFFDIMALAWGECYFECNNFCDDVFFIDFCTTRNYIVEFYLLN